MEKNCPNAKQNYSIFLDGLFGEAFLTVRFDNRREQNRMQQTDLMYALLDMFETTVPGICINDVTVPGYSKEEVRQAVIAMRDQRLIDVVTARDTTGAEYSGCIVGLAPRGGFLRGAHVKNRRPLAAMKES